jgi:polar amino acid transport system substrate-binding protein
MSYTCSRREALLGVFMLPTVVQAAPAWAQPRSPVNGLLARLQAAKSVTVGITNFPPYSGVNLDGSLTGIAPALTKVIMARLGVPKIQAVVATYGELVPGMMAGRWDFISGSLAITKARCGQILFADPIISDGPSLVSIRGQLPNPPKLLADLVTRKLTVGVSAGGALSRVALGAGVRPGYLRQLPDNSALMDALLAKQIQIVFQDNAGIKHVYDQRRLPVDVTYPIIDVPNHQSSYAFRKADTDLYEAFQKELRAMKASGEYLVISRQYGFEQPADMMTLTANQACARSA